jgi:hypothetical protein
MDDPRARKQTEDDLTRYTEGTMTNVAMAQEVVFMVKTLCIERNRRPCETVERKIVWIL